MSKVKQIAELGRIVKNTRKYWEIDARRCALWASVRHSFLYALENGKIEARDDKCDIRMERCILKIVNALVFSTGNRQKVIELLQSICTTVKPRYGFKVRISRGRDIKFNKQTGMRLQKRTRKRIVFSEE